MRVRSRNELKVDEHQQLFVFVSVVGATELQNFENSKNLPGRIPLVVSKEWSVGKLLDVLKKHLKLDIFKGSNSVSIFVTFIVFFIVFFKEMFVFSISGFLQINSFIGFGIWSIRFRRSHHHRCWFCMRINILRSFYEIPNWILFPKQELYFAFLWNFIFCCCCYRLYNQINNHERRWGSSIETHKNGKWGKTEE